MMPHDISFPPFRMKRTATDYDGLLHKPPADLGPLFGAPPISPLNQTIPGFHHDSETSQAEGRRQSEVSKGRARTILTLLKARGPMTRRELADALGVEINCVTSPVDELRRNGKVVETGSRGKSGRLLQAAA